MLVTWQAIAFEGKYSYSDNAKVCSPVVADYTVRLCASKRLSPSIYYAEAEPGGIR